MTDIRKLSDYNLVDLYERQVQWYHYDPHGTKRPSEFDCHELKEEILRRLEKPEHRDAWST